MRRTVYGKGLARSCLAAEDMSRPTSRLLPFVVLGLAVALTAGCSVKRMAIGSLADALAGSGTVFASDDDPELIRDAVPFSLKTIESLLVEVPTHEGLLLSACSGFTQYAYAFVQGDAEMLEQSDFERSRELKLRARKLYVRAKDYCLRSLEVRHRGIGEQLVQAPDKAVESMTKQDVATLYWTGAAWGSAIGLGLDEPELAADLPAVRAMMRRALALDETFERGAIHAAMISIESVPAAMGGSPERARAHFARAVDLSKGLSAGPYYTLASGLVMAEQNRAEFEALIEQALAIDPDADPSQRLANLVVQKRARHLLAHADELFIGDTPTAGAVVPFVALGSSQTGIR